MQMNNSIVDAQPTSEISLSYQFQDFYIHQVEKDTNTAVCNPMSEHRKEYHEIIWIKSGKGKQYLDYQSFNINENTLILISKGQLHLLEAIDVIYGYIIRFNDSFLPSEIILSYSLSNFGSMENL